MSAASVLQRLVQSARRRQVAIVALAGLPLLAAVALIALRLHGVASLTILLAGLIAIAGLAWRSAARLDEAWLSRQLDACMPPLEDSTALLHTDPAHLSRLQRLQRARIERRLAASEPPDLRAPWPRRVLLSAWIVGAAVCAGAIVWTPAPTMSARRDIDAAAPTVAAATATRIVQSRLLIRPPDYMGLPARSGSALEAKLPEGSRLRWTLRFDPDPIAATLIFHDGSRLDFARSGRDWTASRALRASTLYRLQVKGAPPVEDRLYRLDVVADRAPEIRVLQPDHGLVLAEPGQRSWSLAFEASDDYGLGAARLVTTLAQGGGENVTFKARSITLTGTGEATRRRYARELDLTALGMAAGDDLVVQLRVDDNRRPRPHTARSASVILRWPPQTGGESTGVEGVVQRTLPAYFRSQRQIIIDSEALIAQRLRLDTPSFVKRSDAIGVDQRLLRLRYGQFLGEEAESGGPRASGAAAQDDHAGHDHAVHDDRAQGGEHKAAPTADDALFADAGAHDHGGAVEEQPRFGEAGAVLEEFGHTHDHAEAATLLDPETKRLLRAALQEMWQAELHLRQGRPQLALPYEYRALDFVKQVQQADRIYLARVGLELPPIDESRRLGGDRKGLRDRGDALGAAPDADSVLADLWRSLDARQAGEKSGPDGLRRPDFKAIERWVLAHEADLPDPLGLLAALDAVRRDPRCEACVQRLKTALWPSLPAPDAAPGARAAAGRAGQAYLDALERER